VESFGGKFEFFSRQVFSGKVKDHYGEKFVRIVEKYMVEFLLYVPTFTIVL
jgi:hypothetical protein